VITGVDVTPVAPDEVAQLLETRFGLHGFALGSDGRVARAADW
jgi:hypothetical protein